MATKPRRVKRRIRMLKVHPVDARDHGQRGADRGDDGQNLHHLVQAVADHRQVDLPGAGDEVPVRIDQVGDPQQVVDRQDSLFLGPAGVSAGSVGRRRCDLETAGSPSRSASGGERRNAPLRPDRPVASIICGLLGGNAPGQRNMPVQPGEVRLRRRGERRVLDGPPHGQAW